MSNVKYVDFGSRRKNSWRVMNALHEVIADLMAMPDDEFEELLKQHEHGDIAQAMIDSGAAERFLRQWKRKSPKS